MGERSAVLFRVSLDSRFRGNFGFFQIYARCPGPEPDQGKLIGFISGQRWQPVSDRTKVIQRKDLRERRGRQEEIQYKL